MKTLNLVHWYLHCAVDSLGPLSNESLMSRHQQGSYLPDYIHPNHVPRGASFQIVPSHRWKEIDTTPHLFKLHDVLAMTVANWHDVNIYVANAFSGSSSYGVRW